jgi:Ca2+-binding RTX toxin-like protein
VFNLTAVGFADAFVLKLDPNGNFVWARDFGGTQTNPRDIAEASEVVVDGSGNVITTGNFSNTIDFDPGPGIDNRTSAGSSDVFVSKLSPAGQYLWAATFGGADNDRGNSVATDASGNVITAGTFRGTVDFDPGPSVDNRTSNGSSDVFVSKLDGDGDLVWVRTFGGNSVDHGRSVATDVSGNVITSGAFSNTVDFDPGPGVFNLTRESFTGQGNLFVSKLDGDGDFVWARNFGRGGDGQNSVTTDASGNVITTGTFDTAAADFDPGPGVFDLTSAGGYDVFVSKLDGDGGFVWARSFGGTAFDRGLSVAADASGNVITTGSFGGTADFDPGPGVFALTSAGSTDGFVVKLNGDGNLELPPTCAGLAVTVDIGAGQTPTAGPDVILGTPGADVINGLGGDDVICGGGGDDTIFGGPGNDVIFGGDGNDTIFGGDGDDTLAGEAGHDTIQGNAGLDTIDGGVGDDVLSGNDGDDVIDGGLGDDTIYGGAGADTIDGGDGADTILGGLGNDTIRGRGGNDLISGNAGNDTIFGGVGDDTIYGVDGNDTIDGGTGADTILGGDGDDNIVGGDNNDVISGNAGNDTIDGGAGNDTIYGVDGNDTLSGGLGDDIILGGNDNDTINGGGGNDLLSGNDGDDILDGGAGNDEVYGAAGNDTLTGGSGLDVILGGPGDDQIFAADGEVDQVSGNAGTDTCTRDVGIDAVFACEVVLP